MALKTIQTNKQNTTPQVSVMCSQSQNCCGIPDKYTEILETRHRSSGNFSALKLGEPLSHAHPVMGPLDHVP